MQSVQYYQSSFFKSKYERFICVCFIFAKTSMTRREKTPNSDLMKSVFKSGVLDKNRPATINETKKPQHTPPIIETPENIDNNFKHEKYEH